MLDCVRECWMGGARGLGGKLMGRSGGGGVFFFGGAGKQKFDEISKRTKGESEHFLASDMWLRHMKYSILMDWRYKEHH